jgi:hypothetical protein
VAVDLDAHVLEEAGGEQALIAAAAFSSFMVSPTLTGR